MKKVIVISDIHANIYALKAVIENELDADMFIFLGDYITDLPYPMRTLEYLDELQKKYKCIFLKGNREEYLYKHYLNPYLTRSTQHGCLLYTFENISVKELLRLNDLPIFLEVDLYGYQFLISHGSKTKSRQLFYHGSEETREYICSNPYQYYLVGHSHRPFIFHHNNKTIMNPGTCGLNEDELKASYGRIIFDLEPKFELCKIEYNFQEIFDDFKSSNIEEYGFTWAKENKTYFETGKYNMVTILKEAYRLKKENNDHSELIDEHYFLEVIRNID